MNFERLLYEVHAGVAAITMNRPEKRNAIDGRLILDLKAALAEARSNADVRIVTLTGAGRDFCSGADLSELERRRDAGVMANLQDASALADLFLDMRRHPKLIIAVVRGRALAGGCGLATACDLVLAAKSASFGYPEVNIGFVPAIVLAILRRAVPEKIALELITTGTPISAGRARELGIINQVYEDEQFEEMCGSYVKKYVNRPAAALTLCKGLLYHTDALPFSAAVEAGVHMNALARMTEDCRAGVDRFLQK